MTLLIFQEHNPGAKSEKQSVEDEVEELCDKLEIKREELEREIKKKLDSSANLSF